MNNIPILRKNSYRVYLKNGFWGGLIIGFLFFLLYFLTESIESGLYMGLFFWVLVLTIFMGIGYPSEEYFKRKKKINKLKSPKYKFLHEHNFSINEELYFQGIYKNYYFQIFPTEKYQEKKKNLEFDIIEVFYRSEDSIDLKVKEKDISGKYFLGELVFKNQHVGFVPKDWVNPNFKENMDGIISILERENLKPYSMFDWKESIGKKLENEEKENLKSRTKHIIKIGSFEINKIKSEQ